MRHVKLRGKQPIIIILLVSLLLVGGSFAVWACSSNKGVVVSAPQDQPVHIPAIRQLNGRLISFRYSDDYKMEPITADTNTLEGYNFTANTNYEKHLAVTVQHLDVTGLAGLTSYTSRDSRSDVYEKRQITVGQNPAIEFVKKDQTEKTIFIVKGSMAAIFSFVTTSRFDDIDSEITAMLNSFSWKQ